MLLSRGKEGSTMKNLLWMLEDNALQNAADSLMEEIMPIVSTVIWILVAVLAVVFIIKAITTAMAVMKAADEPQVRQEKINGFKYLAIGLGIAIVILSLANIIMTTIMDQGADVELTTFLF